MNDKDRIVARSNNTLNGGLQLLRTIISAKELISDPARHCAQMLFNGIDLSLYFCTYINNILVAI